MVCLFWWCLPAPLTRTYTVSAPISIDLFPRRAPHERLRSCDVTPSLLHHPHPSQATSESSKLVAGWREGGSAERRPPLTNMCSSLLSQPRGARDREIITHWRRQVRVLSPYFGSLWGTMRARSPCAWDGQQRTLQRGVSPRPGPRPPREAWTSTGWHWRLLSGRDGFNISGLCALYFTTGRMFVVYRKDQGNRTAGDGAKGDRPALIESPVAYDLPLPPRQLGLGSMQAKNAANGHAALTKPPPPTFDPAGQSHSAGI